MIAAHMPRKGAAPRENPPAALQLQLRPNCYARRLPSLQMTPHMPGKQPAPLQVAPRSPAALQVQPGLRENGHRRRHGDRELEPKWADSRQFGHGIRAPLQPARRNKSPAAQTKTHLKTPLKTSQPIRIQS
jgi:hypothetical protein